MATITLRSVKGTALTNTEVDSNFQNILNAIGANGSTTIPTPTGTGSPVLSTAPTVTGGSFTALTTLGLRDTSAAYDVTLVSTSSTALSAARVLTFNVVNASRSIKLQGNIDLGGNLTSANAVTFAGNFTQTITATGVTSITLPTSGTLSTLDGIETLTNKTISTGSTWSGNTISTARGGTGSTSTQYCSLTANVSGILPIGNGGTGSSATQYCGLTTNVTGILPTANGGTGLSSFSAGGAVYATSTNALTTGLLPISAGGTGASSTQSAINALVGGASTAGYVLRSNGTNVTMSAIQASDIPTLNQSTTGNAATATSATTATNLASGTTGSIPYQSAASTTAMLAAGTQGKTLVMGASTPTWDSALSSGTIQTASSNIYFDFAVPSWAKQITILFNGLSLSGGNDIIVELGTSGGIDTGSYISAASTAGGTHTSSTVGFIVTSGLAATGVVYGQMNISSFGNNTYLASSVVYNSNAVNVNDAAGQKVLSAALTQIRITSATGTTIGGQQFDAGSVNIIYG